MHTRAPEQVTHIRAVEHLRHFRCIVTTGRQLARDLAGHGADLTFELTHTGFARVLTDHGHHRIRCERDAGALESRLVELTRHQILRGNARLFTLGVTAELHHFHAIQQRTGNVLNEVRRRDEQHFAQIERHAEIVIGEAVVLRRIKHFKQCAGRVALKTVAKFVDFVQQEHRIARASRLHAIDDATRHCTDVCATMTANIRFVAYATERDTHILAAECARDGLRDRCLADTWRSVEQQDRATRHCT